METAIEYLNHKNIKFYLEETPILLDSTFQRDVMIFRRIIEIANRKGFWWGNFQKDNC